MIKPFRKQAGGTLLGLILGLIIGLGIAVVVAVTIKNTPLPFINKLGKPEKPSGPVAGQVSDPNKPLYGNGNAAKEAAKEFARRADEEKAMRAEAEKESAAQSEKKAEAKPVEKPAVAEKAESKADSKPDNGVAKAPVVERSTGAAVEKVSAEKLQKADNTNEKFTYFLQAGAFREQADAENTKGRLALLGVSANVAERQSENGTLYRVRIGPFAQVETMNRMRGKLTDNGVDVAVVRVPK